MRVENIHPHRLSDGSMAFTIQMMNGKGDIVPYVYEMDLAEAAWLARLLTQLVYEGVSK